MLRVEDKMTYGNDIIGFSRGNAAGAEARTIVGEITCVLAMTRGQGKEETGAGWTVSVYGERWSSTRGWTWMRAIDGVYIPIALGQTSSKAYDKSEEQQECQGKEDQEDAARKTAVRSVTG